MAPRLTVRAIRSVGVEVPMTYALGTSRAVITKAPLLLIDLETEEGVTGRSYLWCYMPGVMPAIAAMLEGGGGDRQRRAGRADPSLGQVRATLRAHRHAGHHPHGGGGFRHGGVGCRGDRRRCAACDAGRRRAGAGHRLQQLRARPDGARQGRRRGGAAARRRLRRRQASARLSDVAGGSRGGACGARGASATRSR